ncbi:MAG: M18 family aminopeptidase [Simkaniaceae bacterium]|nr:M18 family aminopeptidase [Simkaniaceae bacterium]
MNQHLLELAAFIHASKTSWHAANEIGIHLAMRDFDLLEEDESWQLKAGGTYFLIRGGALIAFRMPQETPSALSIIASHTDSPGLKLKPNPKAPSENMLTLGTEIYGGPYLSTWFSRDLCLAGRVTILNNHDEIVNETICLDDMPCLIPNLAIHLDRDVNNKGHHINKQEHLSPIIGLSDEKVIAKETLEKMIHRHLFFKELLGFDLFLVPMERPSFLGLNHEMIASYRLDNLLSAHACLHAIEHAEPSKSKIQMAVFWNHEEIGSSTREGADSSFFEDTLRRIVPSEERRLQIKSQSYCISADVAHAYHPNYPAKYDPDHHPLLGHGIVIKHNANMRYATDSESAAHLVHLCNTLDLPHQNYVTRSDLPCGSTIGPLFSSQTGIRTVDIGSPLLAMHAARELAACKDHEDLCKLLTHSLG